VHPADIQDRDGGVLLLSTLFGMYPFLAKLFADAGYQGPQFATTVAEVLPHLSVEIVKRSDQASGFVVRNRQPLAAAFGLWEALARVTVLTSARGAGCRFGGSGGQQCG
jgi:hypothetical protein